MSAWVVVLVVWLAFDLGFVLGCWWKASKPERGTSMANVSAGTVYDWRASG